jgi:hypothetical protein
LNFLLYGSSVDSPRHTNAFLHLLAEKEN